MRRLPAALLVPLAAAVVFDARTAGAEATSLHLEQFCALVTESASLLQDGIVELARPSEDSEADEGATMLTGGCAAALKCLLAARPASATEPPTGKASVSEGLPTAAAAICSKLKPILALSSSELLDLERQAQGLEPDKERPFGLEGCLQFLGCRVSEQSGTPKPESYTALSWRAEFERICAHTRSGAALGPEELRRLVEDSDRLLPTLERLQTSEAKVFIYRLNMCRSFFEYLLEYDELEKEPGRGPPS